MSEIDILNIYAAQQTFIVSILRSSTVMGYINIEHWGGEWNAARVYTGTRAQTKAPAHQQHSVDLLIFSNMVPAEAQ